MKAHRVIIRDNKGNLIGETRYCNGILYRQKWWWIPITVITMLVGSVMIASADFYSPSEIADAIFWAEGGYKAKYYYGIVSVKYNDIHEARQICLNTIKNHYKRHLRHDCGLDYLVCLSKRYCPIGAENDPNNLNVNWLNNVKYYLRNPKGVK